MTSVFVYIFQFIIFSLPPLTKILNHETLHKLGQRTWSILTEPTVNTESKQEIQLNLDKWHKSKLFLKALNCKRGKIP